MSSEVATSRSIACKLALGDSSTPLGMTQIQMKIRVQFYAQLRDLVGIRDLELELPQGATVRELLEKIYGQKPALRAHDKSILIGARLEFVDRNYKPNPGEEIAIMPPVQGG
jgi:molybdopterin converting factor small subunit